MCCPRASQKRMVKALKIDFELRLFSRQQQNFMFRYKSTLKKLWQIMNHTQVSFWKKHPEFSKDWGSIFPSPSPQYYGHVFSSVKRSVYWDLFNYWRDLSVKRRITQVAQTGAQKHLIIQRDRRGKCESCVHLWHNFDKQDGHGEGTAVFGRPHPLSQQTHPHQISTSASSANKREWNDILKPTCHILNMTLEANCTSCLPEVSIRK